jgi:hypothetical protein
MDYEQDYDLPQFIKPQNRRPFDDGNCAKIWTFFDAPPEYRQLSGHGGDEDWVVFIPDGVDIYPLTWDDSYIQYWGHMDRHEVAGGVVIIFAHS